MIRAIIILVLLGILGAIVRPHASTGQCLRHTTSQTTLYQGRYFDLQWPLTYSCTLYYDDRRNVGTTRN